MSCRRVAVFGVLLAFISAGCRISLSARESNGTPAPGRRSSAGRDCRGPRRGARRRHGRVQEGHRADPASSTPTSGLSRSRSVRSCRTPKRRPRLALQQQYERWARQHPKRAVYQCGARVPGGRIRAGRRVLQKALALDPGFARAHFLLARIADAAGDWDAQRQHLKAAVESNRDEPRYLLRYAGRAREERSGAFSRARVAGGRRILQRVRLPPKRSTSSPMPRRIPSAAVIWIGFAPAIRSIGFPYAASAMNVLYGDLTEPSEALALARDMVRALPAATFWPPRVTAQDAMMRAKTLIDGGQFKEAVALLDTTTKPSGNHGTTWTLLKAEAAAGSGNREQAYANADRERGGIARRARRCGPGEIRHRAGQDQPRRRRRCLEARATRARSRPRCSRCRRCRDDAPVRLADFRGRVVLLAFWYPT